MAHPVLVKCAVCRLAVNLQRCFRFTDRIPAAVTSLLLKAGTAGLVRHGSLAAIHKNIILRAFLVCIIHAVYYIAIQFRHDPLPFCNRLSQVTVTTFLNNYTYV